MLSVVLIAALAIPGVLLTGCGGGGGDAVGADVTGVVRDDGSLEPLQGAVVEIDGVQSAPTDAAGQFTVANVGVGTRQMSVNRTGYQTLTGSVQVTSGGVNVGNVYLPPTATPGKGHISGVILESFDSGTGQLDAPVGGATVVSGGKTAHSKPDGTFAVYNVTPGQVSVIAEFNARLARANITVPADATAAVTLRLTVSPPSAPAL